MASTKEIVAKTEPAGDESRMPPLADVRGRLERNRRLHYVDNPFYLASTPNLRQCNAITQSLIAFCISISGFCFYAKYRAAKLKDRRLAEFIDRNLVCSLPNWRQQRWWTLITSSFTHVELPHLALNMFSLQGVGPLALRVFGVPCFVSLWVFGAGACSIASLHHQAWREREEGRSPKSLGRRLDARTVTAFDAEEKEHTNFVGASGSLCALIAALACLMPCADVSMIGVSMRMWVAEISLAGFSIISMCKGFFPKISHAGHLGGMIAGLASYPFIRYGLLNHKRV
ncbi:hypothetical protein ACLMJK_001303 [Lecanora helva]